MIAGFFSSKPSVYPGVFYALQSSYCIGLLESVFRAVVNRSRVYPPLADLSAVFLVRRSCGGVAEWRTGGLARRYSGGLAC
jgi:hypothetical protein